MSSAAEVIKFGDGDDGSGNPGDQFTIDVAENGFVLTHNDDEGASTEVYKTIKEVFDAIKGKL